MKTRSDLLRAKRIVVKVGSALLIAAGERSSTTADDPFLALGRQVAELRARGLEVVLVSSGAIALGWPALGYQSRPKNLAALQAAAAAGQGFLIRRWHEALAPSAPVAQVLLTHADLEHRRRYLNARRALLTLLANGAVPVVNENDTVSVDEIRLGDNDVLAAAVAGLICADLVILLTGADGLFTADPAHDPAAKRLALVTEIDDEIRALAGPPAAHGTGGMSTKILAAQMARTHGAATMIAPGHRPGVLASVLAGDDVGTFFPAPGLAPDRARKRWIATALRPKGTLVIDEGAGRALHGGASLLSAGVSAVHGSFVAGDAVTVVLAKNFASGSSGHDDHDALARGLCGLGSDEAQRVCGLSSAAVKALLGDATPDALIHRDDLVLLADAAASS